MGEGDKRNTLDVEVFSYHPTKDGKVFIYWYGKQILALKEDQAQKLLAQLATADSKQVHLALANVTGNFEYGNKHRA